MTNVTHVALGKKTLMPGLSHFIYSYNSTFMSVELSKINIINFFSLHLKIIMLPLGLARGSCLVPPSTPHTPDQSIIAHILPYTAKARITAPFGQRTSVELNFFRLG